MDSLPTYKRARSTAIYAAVLNGFRVLTAILFVLLYYQPDEDNSKLKNLSDEFGKKFTTPQFQLSIILWSFELFVVVLFLIVAKPAGNVKKVKCVANLWVFVIVFSIIHLIRSTSTVTNWYSFASEMILRPIQLVIVSMFVKDLTQLNYKVTEVPATPFTENEV